MSELLGVRQEIQRPQTVVHTVFDQKELPNDVGFSSRVDALQGKVPKKIRRGVLKEWTGERIERFLSNPPTEQIIILHQDNRLTPIVRAGLFIRAYYEGTLKGYEPGIRVATLADVKRALEVSRDHLDKRKRRYPDNLRDQFKRVEEKVMESPFAEVEQPYKKVLVKIDKKVRKIKSDQWPLSPQVTVRILRDELNINPDVLNILRGQLGQQDVIELPLIKTGGTSGRHTPKDSLYPLIIMALLKDKNMARNDAQDLARLAKRILQGSIFEDLIRVEREENHLYDVEKETEVKESIALISDEALRLQLDAFYQQVLGASEKRKKTIPAKDIAFQFSDEIGAHIHELVRFYEYVLKKGPIEFQIDERGHRRMDHGQLIAAVALFYEIKNLVTSRRDIKREEIMTNVSSLMQKLGDSPLRKMFCFKT